MTSGLDGGGGGTSGGSWTVRRLGIDGKIVNKPGRGRNTTRNGKREWKGGKRVLMGGVGCSGGVEAGLRWYKG